MNEATRQRLLDLFFEEAQSSLQDLERLAEALVEPNDQAAADFGRIVHGLKGAAAAVGLPLVAELMHAFEALALETHASRGAARAPLQLRLARMVRGLQVSFSGGPSALTPGALQGLFRIVEPQRPASPSPEVAAANLPPPVAGEASGLKAAATGTSTGASASVDEASSASKTLRTVEPAALEERRKERLAVSADELDVGLRLASQLARESAMLEESLTRDQSAGAGAAQALARASEQLEQLLFGLRLVPAQEAMAGLEDEVRVLAQKLGRQASLTVQGLEVRADRGTLQLARSLVRHLLRNAVDHGIEVPEARLGVGKPPQGALTLTLSMVEGELRLDLSDDGAGFDAAMIRARLVEASPALAQVIKASSDDDVIQRFAEQGGSTREQASDVSGRGLGLSAVAATARSRGGDFMVRSRAGQGTQVTFSLPLDVFATDVLTVSLGDVVVGLPLSAVERTLFLPRSSVVPSPTSSTLAIDERIVPLSSLALALGLDLPVGPEPFAVVVEADGRQAGFSVPVLGVTTRLVPRPVPPLVHPEALVSGVATLADGSLLQLINARRLLDLVSTAQASAPRRPETSRRALDVVLAEDSLATREVLRVLLEEEGHRVRVAADGAEALSRVAEAVPDVVLSDVNMPRLDGFGLTRAVRQRPGARIPVILLTSQDDERSRAEGAAAGADAYLIKASFSAGLLRETLQRLGFPT
jgi:two-component system, chemotaxis family, sensor kinase CheA